MAGYPQTMKPWQLWPMFRVEHSTLALRLCCGISSSRMAGTGIISWQCLESQHGDVGKNSKKSLKKVEWLKLVSARRYMPQAVFYCATGRISLYSHCLL